MDYSDYTFSLPMSVRDYEIDYQGIVNNANYLHYLEHTRHEFCRQAGLSFGEMHSRGIDPVLAHISIDYRQPLHIGDEFVSCLNIGRRGPKFYFQQDIYLPDGTPVIKAMITVACIENGHLTRGDVLAQAFGKYLKTI
ncbi:MAG: acyl-CoA thioesterase [Muribaculaceae bacterium]|nr:acyl-CoA thioesterase [Muribaculaceae bacterium]